MLPEIDFSVFIIRPPQTGQLNVYDQSRANITYGSVNNFNAVLKLWRFGLRNRDALFHGFNIGPVFLLTIRLAGLMHVVYSIRGTKHYTSRLQKSIRKLVWRLAISDNYRFIANSKYSRDIFRNFIEISEAKLAVLYNPVNSIRIKTIYKPIPGKSMTIIYAGRLAEGKNLFRWIDTAGLIKKKYYDSSFIIYGDGPLRQELADYCRNSGAEKFVSFRGHVHNIAYAYNQADLMIFLSEYESFGNAVVECILCGTPVIASAVPSMNEIFMNYPQFLVPLDKNMGENILEKIDRMEELIKILPAVKEEFSARFSMEQHIYGLRKIYNGFDFRYSGSYTHQA